MPASSFRFEPHDVLFFRDGKPSSLGEDHYHRSIFPPHCSTLYGAIRTRRLVDAHVDLAKLSAATWNELVPKELQSEIGTPQTFGTASMRGPWLTRRQKQDEPDEVLLPAPSDLGIIEKRATGTAPPRVTTVVRYRPDEDSASAASSWSHPFALLRPYRREGAAWTPFTVPPEEDDPAPAQGWFLRLPGMEAWLDGDVPEPEDFVHSSELWREEVRTGVGLKENVRSSETSKLYTFGFVRLMPGVCIGFDLSECALTPGVPISLGGEGRTGTLLDGPPLALTSRSAEGRFSLYLGTPAFFDNGCVPDSFDPQTNQGIVAGAPCRLISPVCRGFDLIGGWDVARMRPKPLRRALPAGTVLLFEQINAPAPQAQGAFMNADLLKQGFGLSLVGAST